MKRAWLAIARFAVRRASDYADGPAWRVARTTTDAEWDAAYANWEDEVVNDEAMSAEEFDRRVAKGEPVELNVSPNLRTSSVQCSAFRLRGTETITTTTGGAVTWTYK